MLHRRPYRETSLLVSLLTPEQGRVDAVAKGVRGHSKRAVQKAAWLQPFQPLRLRWRARQSGLVTLSQFEPEGACLSLQDTALACGFYLNELLMRLLPQGVSLTPLFEQYVMTLGLLARHGDAPAQSWLLRQFELALLDVLGAGLHLPVDFHPGRRYRWQTDAGWLITDEGIEGRCIEALLAGRLMPDCLAQQKRLLQGVLSAWLGPKPLQSAHLLKPLFNRKKT